MSIMLYLTHVGQDTPYGNDLPTELRNSRATQLCTTSSCSFLPKTIAFSILKFGRQIKALRLY